MLVAVNCQHPAGAIDAGIQQNPDEVVAECQPCPVKDFCTRSLKRSRYN
jgi:hypothetical protein